MRVFPASQGPMVHWPKVEAIPGIKETLPLLHPSYRLVLATNAAESGAALVRAALSRAGIEDHFDAVLTARELGVSKPDPAFFQTVLEEINCAPREAMMVGDSYQADVMGAKRAGLRAVWFNPGALPCPPVDPVHDAEIHTLPELVDVVQNLHLPDIDECMALLAEQDAPPGVIKHSQAVANAAFRMAGWLRELGEKVDPLLAHRGGLLHDLDKISSRQSNQRHGQLGASILHKEDYPQLADIVKRHVMSMIFDPDEQPTTWEEKLVYYADKIVEGDQIVSVAERWKALHQRYPEVADMLQRGLPLVLELEANICAHLGVSPESLRKRLGACEDRQ